MTTFNLQHQLISKFSVALAEPVYTEREEYFNTLTHVVAGFMMALATSILLWQMRTFNVVGTGSVVTYGIAVKLLFAASSWYHACPPSRRKEILRMCDHASIFVCIAGTCTPVLWVHRTTVASASALLLIIWVVASIGIVHKFLSPNRYKPLAMSGYVVLVSMLLTLLPILQSVLPARAIGYFFAGFATYGVAIFFYLSKHIRYAHTIWHLLIMVATALHFAATWLALLN